MPKPISPMNSKPTISVVIPAYNAAHYLSDTIHSVLAQSYTDWELLIINDGSTDTTESVVNRYCQQDGRIQLVTKENGGVSSSRNLGATLAKGELIAFLDADDKWLPNKLAVHAEYMHSHPEVGVSFARVELMNSDGSSMNKLTSNQLTQLQPQEFLYSNPTVTTSNVVIRRDLFHKMQGFDQTINHSEDMELLFRIASCSDFKIEGINQTLVQYRIHNTGLSSTLKNMEDGWKKMLEKARQLHPELVSKHYASAYASQLQYLARQTLRLGLPPELGVDFVNRAFQADWGLMIRQRRSMLIAITIYATYFVSRLSANPVMKSLVK